jgi:hypothetical protein
MAQAVATGGVGGAGSVLGSVGAANSASSATTVKGALAQAQSTALGSSGQAQSTAKTTFAGAIVQSSAAAPTNGSTATTNAIAQGGPGQAFVNPGQTAYAFSTASPNRVYAATLIDGASHVASALLGPRDAVFGTAILGANYTSDGDGLSYTYSASSTFDFTYGGDLELGLIADQESGFVGGAGFQSMEFTIEANGVEILDTTFRSLAIAESFFHDDVIDLGSDFGPNLDLTFGYTLVADGSGGFGFDFAIGGAVPEPSTWAMMLVGFAGLGFAGCRSTRRQAAVAFRA